MQPQYSLVLLQGTPAALDPTSGAPLDPTPLIIKITAPLFLAQLNLPAQIKLSLTPNSHQTITLLRTDLTSPRGKYQVSYSRPDNPKSILASEEWIVGPNPQRSYSTLILNSNLSYQLPANTISQVDLLPQPGFGSLPPYTITGDILTFNSPPVPQTALLSYQLPLRREHILYSPNTRYHLDTTNSLPLDRFITYTV